MNLALVNAYIPFVIIFIGVVFNTSSFLLLMFHQNLKVFNSMRILAFISFVETFTLFTFNIDHFYKYYFNRHYEINTVFLCRLMTFLQYASLDASAWLLTFLTLHRLITIQIRPGSVYENLSTIKFANISSILIILITCLVNSHILMFNGFYDFSNNTNNSESTNCGTYTTGFKLFPFWDQFQMYFCFLIPNILMIIFDMIFIFKLVRVKSKSTKKKIKKLTISIIVISLVYIIMNLPANLFWSYLLTITKENYGDFADSIGGLLDSIMFLNHSSIFFTCYFTNLNFKLAVHSLFGSNCERNTLHKFTKT